MARLPSPANVPGNDQTLDDYTPLPSGNYTAMVVQSEFKETKAKTGHYLQLRWKVIEGEFKDRLIFDNLNLDNPNPVAVEIARKRLNTICKAAGKVGVEDSEELHGIPVDLTVKLKKGDAQNPDSNDISGYKEAGTAGSAGDTPEFMKGNENKNPAAQQEGQSTPPEVPGDPPGSTGAPDEGKATTKKLPWE
jgi:hypothetical protein